MTTARRGAATALASALLVVLGGIAAAEPVPDVSICAATSLQVTAQGTPMHVEYRDKPTHYFTNLNVFVTNVGGVPCYLMGAPVVSLRAAGRDVGSPYSRERSDLSEVQVAGAAEFVLGPLLLPFATSRQYAELVGSWNAPYCGKPVQATVAVTSATGNWPAKGVVPPPPCRGSRKAAGTETSEWAILTAR